MKKLLVIDDDEGILEALQLLLEAEGYEVIPSYTARNIDNIIKENHPDLILLDVLLSGEDGRVVCAHLKEKNETKDIPVVMISAHPSVKDSISKCGANAFIPKPFDSSDLISKIQSFLI